MSTSLDSHRSSVVPAPAMRDLARRLLAQGASPGLTQRVVARVETLGRSEENAHPLDLAARVIGESFPRVVMRAPRTGPAVLSVLGSRGSGRSTFVRKLALRLRGTGRRVSVLAVAQHGSSRPEWIATWMSEIGAFGCVVDAERDMSEAGPIHCRWLLILQGSIGEYFKRRAFRVVAGEAEMDSVKSGLLYSRSTLEINPMEMSFRRDSCATEHPFVEQGKAFPVPGDKIGVDKAGLYGHQQPSSVSGAIFFLISAEPAAIV